MKQLLLAITGSLFLSVVSAQTEEDLRANFLTPPLANRMNVNQHALPKSETDQNNYFDVFLNENGYGGIATNVSTNNYLESPADFEAFCNGVRMAKSKGYKVWLYDEKLYPSGMAGNKVLHDHPEWEAEGLLIYRKSISANESVHVSMPGTVVLAKAVPVVHGTILYDKSFDISNFFTKGTLNWKSATGTWYVVLIMRDVLYSAYQAGTERGGEYPHYPSLLMPEVTRLFIDYTHKRYANAFGEKLGKYFTSTFTDEPSTMALPYSQLGYGVYPWKQVLSDEFKIRYGYELKDKLLKITLDNGSEGKLLRYQYFQLVTDLISKNYFGLLKDYCHSQNFKSGGHLLLEESIITHVPLYGNIMACYRKMDIPGIDCLTGLPNKTRAYMISSRLAASAAELEGNSSVMYESCPIDNDLPDNKEPPTIDVKGVHNRVIVGGVTDFNNYLKLSYENPVGRRVFNDYTARVVSMLSGGVRASRIAVYYPIETMWTKWKPADMRLNSWWSVVGADPQAHEVENLFNNTTYSLIDNGWEFSYIDAQGLVEATVRDKQLCHGNGLKWDVIILPGVETLPKQAFDRIVEFIKKGGKVIALNKLPVNSESLFPSKKIKYQFEKYVDQSVILYDSSFSSGKLNSQLEKLLDRDIVMNSYAGVMHSHKRINGKDVFFIINDTNADKSIKINLPSGGPWELWDPQTGKISKVPSAFDQVFGPYDSIILRTASSM